ncbi:MAG: TetR/AcrR family transcriptional regulator [Deltaproteobacteria bacterium]|nr:TetR/AcrR family transcriptional regulator [Deltaproteobacteria bacterium]
MPSPSKRDQIVDVALDLFYQGGFNATGVDKIALEAGVTKKTLYAHFKSKDELILAVLRRRDEIFRNQFMRNVERLGKNPRQRLEAIFDTLDEWFNGKKFCGCMFINASAEFSDQGNPCHLVCAEHKRLMQEYFRDLAEKAGAQDPDSLSEELMFLAEGATVQAHVCGDKRAGQKAKRMARLFIDSAINLAGA